MASGDLTTLAAVKAWGGNIQAGGDAVLASLITAASAWISTFTDRNFAGAQTYSEIRSGSGGTELFVRNGPLLSVTSLTVNGNAIPAQSADGVPGYFVAGDNVLALYGYTFTRGRNNVRVTYSGGYAAVPADIAQACNEIVVSAYRRGQRGPDVDSESYRDGQTFHFSLADVPASAKLVLERWQRVAPA